MIDCRGCGDTTDKVECPRCGVYCEENDPNKGASFVVQVHKITVNKDGGGRIELNFGSDAFKDIQAVQRVAIYKHVNFQAALVPIKKIEWDELGNMVSTNE